MLIQFSVRSETGKVRTNNEDNFYCNGIFMTPSEREKPFFMKGNSESPCLFAVFDGMGGMDCGEIASLTAVETLTKYSEKILNGNYKNVDEFVREVNERLDEFSSEQNIITGATMALVIVREDSFTVYNLGDSRIYGTKNGILTRLTDDHTVAEDKVRMGILTPKQAERSRERNILTRYLGTSADEFSAMPDSQTFKFNNENMRERILICSDGLTDMLTHKELSMLVINSEDSADTVNRLTEAALMKGGHDNITCIVIEK